MRIFPPDYDLPDGVMDPPRAAAEIAAERKAQAQRAQARQRALSSARRGRIALIRPAEAARRARLLARARAGDPAALQVLASHYRLRLVQPE